MQRLHRKRVLVAMSGGVDSCVTAALLADRGHEVIGVTMRLYDAPYENAAKLSKSCCGLEDVEDARSTCRIIGARHYYMNFEREFEQHVVNYFVSEYEQGRTPYPCLACNDRMKFDFLLKRAHFLGADALATGHYARIVGRGDGSFSLVKGIDEAKDQSYALFNLTQDVLKQLMFPIGHYTKDETRRMALKFGLPIANKRDSQDICFIPSGKYREFVAHRVRKSKPGNVIHVNGAVLANHDGVHNFTIGQRKGVPGSDVSSRPIYVKSIDTQTGTVVVGHAEDLLTTAIRVDAVNWISGSRPLDSDGITARIRYRSPEVGITITPTAENGALVYTAEPVRAATPGQAIVFYKGETVLGGGIIETTVSAPSTAGGPNAAEEWREQADALPRAERIGDPMPIGA